MINFKQIFSDWRVNRQKKCAANCAARHTRIANQKVNVIEFNGAVYFAFDGIPLIPVAGLKDDITKVLPKSRETFKNWNNETNHGW